MPSHPTNQRLPLLLPPTPASAPLPFNPAVNLRLRNDHLIKLSISHALAQSAKLSVYEERVIEIVESTKDLPEALAATGKVRAAQMGGLRWGLARATLGCIGDQRLGLDWIAAMGSSTGMPWDCSPTAAPIL